MFLALMSGSLRFHYLPLTVRESMNGNKEA
jgi:hypothetical protein